MWVFVSEKIKIIEVKSEIGAGTRGASLGVEAIKIASLDIKSDFFRENESVEVEDVNELLFNSAEHAYAKFIDGVLIMEERVCLEVYEQIFDDFFPMIMAGDHSTAYGTIAGIKKAHPKKRLGVVWIDAHADFHTPYTTPSGNMHGMPLAVSIAEDNAESGVHDLDEKTSKLWDQLKKIGKINQKVLPEDIVFISLRDFEKEEKHLIEKHGMKVITTSDVRRNGAENISRKVLRYLSDCTDIYVSFDVDSLDAAISRGTGTPVSNGLREREAEDLISKFMQSRKICCFEITEVNPTLDKENLMAEIAFNILQRSVNVLMMN